MAAKPDKEKEREKEKEKETPEASPKEEAAPRRSKLIWVVLGVLLVAGAGGGGAFAFLRKPAKPVRRPATIGPVQSLESFIVNLDEPSGTRYLKVTLDVELGAATEEEFKRLAPRFRDRILANFSRLKVPDILSHQKKAGIKKEILAVFVDTLGRDAVKAVYFKEFVMQ